jgi:phospholipase C
MWGVKYIGSSGWLAEFLERGAAGTLPAVSFVDPIYTVLDDGTGNDDHPHADIRNGDAFLAAVFHAVAGGPAWDKTGLIINFDEWGGFFEHVAPPARHSAESRRFRRGHRTSAAWLPGANGRGFSLYTQRGRNARGESRSLTTLPC